MEKVDYSTTHTAPHRGFEALGEMTIPAHALKAVCKGIRELAVKKGDFAERITLGAGQLEQTGGRMCRSHADVGGYADRRVHVQERVLHDTLKACTEPVTLTWDAENLFFRSGSFEARTPCTLWEDAEDGLVWEFGGIAAVPATAKRLEAMCAKPWAPKGRRYPYLLIEDGKLYCTDGACVACQTVDCDADLRVVFATGFLSRFRAGSTVLIETAAGDRYSRATDVMHGDSAELETKSAGDRWHVRPPLAEAFDDKLKSGPIGHTAVLSPAALLSALKASARAAGHIPRTSAQIVTLTLASSRQMTVSYRDNEGNSTALSAVGIQMDGGPFPHAMSLETRLLHRVLGLFPAGDAQFRTIGDTIISLESTQHGLSVVCMLARP